MESKAGILRKFLFFIIALFFGSVLKAYYDTNFIKINKVQIRTKKIPSGSKVSILQVSDLHNKVFGINNEMLINKVKETNADIIVLTGDLISRGTTDFNNVYTLVEILTDIHQNVYYVTGNHELANSQVEEFLTGLRDRGVVLLRNDNRVLSIHNTTINLVGIDNESTNHEDMSLAFTNVSNSFYTILLSHSPSVVNKYKCIPTDLILSGHTHGGQVRLPLVGALVGPDRSLFPALDKGVFEVGTEQLLYIDSGVGTTGYPIRFMNQSQITLIELAHGEDHVFYDQL